jgi:ABC-type transport system involved in multi-copper enzyme maturation permease subunit
MLIGPVFTREAVTLPRRTRFFIVRTLYVAILFGLMVTTWLILIGNQEVRNTGDWARFGGKLFAIIAPLQLAIVTLLSSLVAAAAVAQEKDRRTLVLLLLTRLTNSELVVGKLLASMLTVLTMIFATVPLLFIAALLGGVSPGQIFRVCAITLVSALAAGSLGSTIALWREKTFQALALTALVLVLWLLAWELVAAGALGRRPFGLDAAQIATAFSPWRAILAAARPVFDEGGLWNSFFRAEGLFVLVAAAGTLALNGAAIGLVRVWNPSRQARPASPDEEESAASVPGTSSAALARARQVKTRPVWDNPVLWREMRTWAYGRKILAIKAVYLIVFTVCTVAIIGLSGLETVRRGQDLIPAVAGPVIPLLVVSIILVNALAVTSITTERDGRALDLLLVTDISPAEFMFGKLGGVLYNVKEMIVLPVGLCGYLWAAGQISSINLGYLLGGLLVMYAFAAMLGVHAGLTYANSKSAIGTSLGTLLFLFLGVATCMRIMVAFQGEFGYQLFSFSAFLLGGGIGLFVALGARNPSSALLWASLAAPFATFFVITSFLLGQYGAMFLVTAVTYGAATAAMLVPALDEFDVATGRSTDIGH